MNSFNNRQSGFGVLGVLVAVVAVAIIGGVGFMVFKKSSDTRSSSTPTSTVPAPAPRADESGEAQTAKPGEPQPYLLEIKEWGVILPLPERVKDAYYTTAGSNTGDDGLSNTAWISLTSLDGTSCDVAKTGPTKTATPVGFIGRALPSDEEPVKQVLYTKLYPNGVTIGGYYYFYVSATDVKCASNESLQTINSALTSATKSAAANQ